MDHPRPDVEVRRAQIDEIMERDLATAYLQAQIDFQAGLTNQVINNLEYVYSINPLYANGTALQTLYESYMERGDIRTATGELEAALEDFKKAAEISLQADSYAPSLPPDKKGTQRHGKRMGYGFY